MRNPTPTPAALLLVADDRNQRASLADALAAGGLRVTAVGTRAPVIAAVDATAGFDAVVLDVQEPDGAALAVARHLLATGDTPLVMLVARASSMFRSEDQALGLVTQLVKPVDPALLLQVMLGVVNHCREQRRLRAENGQLERAVGQARDISVVVGILMERFGLDRASAFEALRRQSRSRRMKLADFAHTLVGAEERLQAFGAKLPGAQGAQGTQARP
jgi:AmiR/NasT family two-component response regulator